jgi:hypothetical protein
MVRISPHPLGGLIPLISFLVLAIQRLPAMRSQGERMATFQPKEIILSKSIGCEIANACSRPRPLPPLHDNVERIASPTW